MNDDNALAEARDDGIFPGAGEWTESHEHGSWYREQGAEAAMVYPGTGTLGRQWNIRVWLRAAGLNGPGSWLAESSVACFSLACHDQQSLEMAKDTADRMLALREVPPQ